MPQAPKILARSKKKKFLSDEHFFELLSQQNNYADPKLMGDFYMGMVKVVMEQIKLKGYVRLPHLGDFAYVHHKKKFALMGGRQPVRVDGVRVLRFYPLLKLRSYFSAWNKNHHVRIP